MLKLQISKEYYGARAFMIDTVPEKFCDPIIILLEEVLPERKFEGKIVVADRNSDGPGMTQWKILFVGVLRLGLNTGYDHIHELDSESKILWRTLGHRD